MRRIRLSNLFHSVGAAKLKDLSKNVLEQFLLSGGITNNKSSLAERVFVELLFLLPYASVLRWHQSYIVLYLLSLQVMVIEGLQTMGLTLLMFRVLPQLTSAAHGAALLLGTALVPAVLNLVLPR